MISLARSGPRALCALLLAASPALAPAQDAAPPPAATTAPEPSLALQLGAGEGAARAAPGDEVRFRLAPPFADPAFVVPDRAPRKNSLLALGEVVGINFVMWQTVYWLDKPYAKISTETIGDNFSKGWIIDTDAFWTNQFGHPYEGSAFYTAARSTGHGPYESFGFAFLGSLIWEHFMETQSPSVNDQVTTPGGGSVLGEALYRMYRLVLDSGGARPSGWRRFGAFAVSPVSGANDFLFDDRYRGPTMLPPSWMGEFHFGMVVAGEVKDLQTGARAREAGPWGNVAAHVGYGVPGDPALRLRKPFDHFDFRGSMSFTDQEQPTASLLIRGLLLGDTLGPSSAPHGLWGLFTSYDVISVPVFKATGFGVGPGVSLRGRWGSFELHGTALVEFLPWAGGGSHEKIYQRDYHYGPGGMALLDLRALYGDRFILDLQSRGYLISGAYATGSSEDVTWSRAALTGRVVGPHALSASVDYASRRARYPANPDIEQRGAVYLVHYTLLQGW